MRRTAARYTSQGGPVERSGQVVARPSGGIGNAIRVRGSPNRSAIMRGCQALIVMALAAFAAFAPAPALAQNAVTANKLEQTSPADIRAETPETANTAVTGAITPHSANDLTQQANTDERKNSDVTGSGDDWGWLKVVMGGLLGASTVLATQWITARTNRQIASEQAQISRSAVQVAEDAAKASALGASAAIESAGAARESAAVAGRNADNVGVHAVARLRQEWINTVRDELSKLHSALVNYRPLPAKATPAQLATHEQRQRDANQIKAKLALLLNPREIPSRNLSKVISRLDSPTLSTSDRARWARWIVRWGQILLKEEWDRVRSELKGEKRVSPFRRDRRA